MPATANNFVSLEFGNATGGNKGVILPWVTAELPLASTVPGTLIFDSATQKVKMAVASTANAAQSTGWKDFTGAAEVPPTFFKNPAGLTERMEAKAIIGAAASSTNGIFVLETPNPATEPKAMILPRVNSYTDIVNPSAGMIVYITSTSTLAVFNGKEWSFWKGN